MPRQHTAFTFAVTDLRFKRRPLPTFGCQGCEATDHQDAQQHNRFVVSEPTFRSGGRVPCSESCETTLSGSYWGEDHLYVTEWQL